MEHICLIDGTNMLRRAWSVADRKQDADGNEIGASILFAQMLRKLLRRMAAGRIPPTSAAIFFDPDREDNWRRDISPDYKAARPETDQDLAAQIPLMRGICAAAGISQGLAARHEADDLIGAYALDAHAAGMAVSIISNDKDLMQLVRPGIVQFNPISETWVNQKKVWERFGIPPRLLPDMLALIGDKGKGVPGAPGIGEETARGIILQAMAHASKTGGAVPESCLDLILDECQNPEIVARPSARKSLMENGDAVRMSHKMSLLDTTGAPRPFALRDTRLPDPETAAILISDMIGEMERSVAEISMRP